MTGGSFLIMGPKHCWIVLHVSILAALLLAINADSEEVRSKTQKSEECIPEIRVRRNTVYEATLGQDLRVNCTIVFCNNPPPTVSWNKFGETDLLVNSSSNSHIKMEWKMFKEIEGTSFLVFRNILLSDSGQYQCRTEGDVGHTINISVHDNNETANVTKNNVTRGPKSDPEIPVPWMYVYCTAGIATFVIIVIIISVISMRGCKGKSKKKPENQYIELPMVQQPSPRANFQASPRGSPSVPPSRRSTKRKTPPRQTNELRLSRGNEQLYGHMEEDRMRQSNTGQEEASIVYAALNHHQPPRPAARARLQVEENSEYAAIRVA